MKFPGIFFAVPYSVIKILKTPKIQMFDIRNKIEGLFVGYSRSYLSEVVV
jgi:hypothetical protein